jgi:hypothetical protein
MFEWNNNAMYYRSIFRKYVEAAELSAIWAERIILAVAEHTTVIYF